MNNPDAINRLKALSAPNAAPISMAEHQTRLNDTLVRKRTDAKMRSDRLGRQPRRAREEERARVEADKAARIAAGTAPPIPPRPGVPYEPPRVISSAPRVGEIMSPSPGPYHPAMFSSGSFPRPPIPHQAWGEGQPNSLPGPRIDGKYSLQDNGPTGNGGGVRRVENRQKRKDDGPATFAEMGFVSKPVEDEGCTVM